MLTVISCNWAPGDAGSSSGYRCWRKLRLILKWGRPTSNNFGAKAHANLLKDWKVLFQQTANPTAYRKKLALPLYQNARSYWIQYWFTNGYYISDPSGIPSYYIPFPPFYRFFAPWCLWVTLLCMVSIWYVYTACCYMLYCIMVCMYVLKLESQRGRRIELVHPSCCIHRWCCCCCCACCCWNDSCCLSSCSIRRALEVSLLLLNTVCCYCTLSFRWWRYIHTHMIQY